MYILKLHVYFIAANANRLQNDRFVKKMFCIECIMYIFMCICKHACIYILEI